MNKKSLFTHVMSFTILVAGYWFGIEACIFIGLFSLSGALTNELAIHMLFERVPLLYGSGVIEKRFESLKDSLYELIMNQFFTQKQVEKFFQSEFEKSDKHFDFTELIEVTDITPAFESLKQAVMESNFGGMLGMFGGEKALDSLQEPFEEKMKKSLQEIVHTDDFQNNLKKVFEDSQVSEDIIERVSLTVSARLEELTPQLVKEIVQKMIKEHLGWLVVWGGFFGGLIGLISSLVL